MTDLHRSICYSYGSKTLHYHWLVVILFRAKEIIGNLTDNDEWVAEHPKGLTTIRMSGWTSKGANNYLKQQQQQQQQLWPTLKKMVIGSQHCNLLKFLQINDLQIKLWYCVKICMTLTWNRHCWGPLHLPYQLPYCLHCHLAVCLLLHIHPQLWPATDSPQCWDGGW